VKDPALQVDFVTANMVRDVSVSGGLVRVGINLTSAACPSRDVITTSIQEAVADLPGVTAVEVDLGVNTLGRANNPLKEAGLRKEGVNVLQRVAHWVGENQHNQGYLAVKRRKMGHHADNTPQLRALPKAAKG